MLKRWWHWWRTGGRGIYLEYISLGLLVMLPLLRPGYIFALDMIFTPHMPWPVSVDNSYLYSVVLHYLTLVLPSQLIQKVLLLAILVLAGAGMHRLMIYAFGEKASAVGLTSTKLGCYFAGIFYMINPFTYERLIGGQYLLILGYALLPWFTQSLWRWLRDPTWRLAIPFTLQALLISIVSVHSIFFVALTTLTLAVVEISRHPSRAYFLKLAKWGSLALVALVAASSYWLIPTLQGHGSTAGTIQGFGQAQIDNFQTAGDASVGVLGNTLGLYGFWQERDARYTLPKTIIPAWFGIFLLIFGLVIWGIRGSWRKDKAMTVALIALGTSAWVLGIGIAYGPFAGIYHFMVAHVPMFQGFREPQKFIGILALVYAWFGAFGVREVIQWVRRNAGEGMNGAAEVVSVLLLLLPLGYTPTMLWGFAGQLPPADYPADWYALNRELGADHDSFKVLFLPWHQYLSFTFTEAIVANPAQNFFDKPVIQGDNFELGSIPTQSKNPVSSYITKEVLDKGADVHDAGARLAALKVKYVVVAKEVDWKKTDFLGQQNDLTLVKDTANLRVYKNKAFKK